MRCLRPTSLIVPACSLLRFRFSPVRFAFGAFAFRFSLFVLRGAFAFRFARPARPTIPKPRASEASPWVRMTALWLRPVGAKVLTICMLRSYTFALTGRRLTHALPTQGAAPLALGFGLLAFQAVQATETSTGYATDKVERRLCGIFACIREIAALCGIHPRLASCIRGIRGIRVPRYF